MNCKPEKPIVSIITAVLNRPEPLTMTMESVLSQYQPGVEHIVVDGASSDATCTVLEQYGRFGIRWISEPDRGIYDALNKGIALAHGAHIWVVQAGDVLLPGAAKAVSEYLYQQPESIWYADSRIGDRLARAPESITPAILLYNLGIAHQSIIAPRTSFNAVCPYNHEFRIVSDYLWMRDAHCRGVTFRKMSGCYVHLDATGLSSGQTEAARQLFENEVAWRTLNFYPFIPRATLRDMYTHRLNDRAKPIIEWMDHMESCGSARAIDVWVEFREAMEDYIERLSAGRSASDAPSDEQ